MRSCRNETILRDDLKVDDLIEIIKRVKRQVPVPVTTGETHDVWRGFTKLNRANRKRLRERNKRSVRTMRPG